jgi:hypothetical protein
MSCRSTLSSSAIRHTSWFVDSFAMVMSCEDLFSSVELFRFSCRAWTVPFRLAELKFSFPVQRTCKKVPKAPAACGSCLSTCRERQKILTHTHRGYVKKSQQSDRNKYWQFVPRGTKESLGIRIGNSQYDARAKIYQKRPLRVDLISQRQKIH